MGNEIQATLRINGDPTGAVAAVNTVTATARALGADAITINQRVAVSATKDLDALQKRAVELQAELTRMQAARAALPASTPAGQLAKADNSIIAGHLALEKVEKDLLQVQQVRIQATSRTTDALQKELLSNNKLVSGMAQLKLAYNQILLAGNSITQSATHMGAAIGTVSSSGGTLAHIPPIFINIATAAARVTAAIGNTAVGLGKLGMAGVQGIQKLGTGLSSIISAGGKVKNTFEQVGYGVFNSGVHFGELAVRLQGAQVAAFALGSNLTNMGNMGRTALTDLLTLSGEFQQKVITIQAILGKSGEALAGPLRDLAIKLSETSLFSPTETADVISELIKGGVAIKDVMGGAAQAVMNLSTATGEGLDRSIQSVISATTEWANQNVNAQQAVNSLTKVANATASDVNSLASGMKNAGAVAASMGVSIDNTLQLLGALSNAGLKGAEGGTALRYFFLNLVPSTNKAIDMMKQLGLLTYDYSEALKTAADYHVKLTGNQEHDLNVLYQKFANTEKTFDQAIKDGDGAVGKFQQFLSSRGIITSAFVDTQKHELKDAADILQILYDKVYNKVGGGVEGTKLLSQLFGERGGSKAAAPLMIAFQKNLDDFHAIQERMKTESGKALEDDQKLVDNMSANLIGTIRKQLDNYGSAEEIAAKRTEGFTGSLHYLQSSFDGLKIVMGEPLLQPVAGFLRLLGDLVNKTNEFIKLNPNVATAIGKFLMLGTAVASLGGPLLILVAALPYVITAFSLLITQFTMLIVGVVAVGAALSILAGAGMALADSILNPSSGIYAAMNGLVGFLRNQVDALKNLAISAFVNIMYPIMQAVENGIATFVIPAFVQLTTAVMKLAPVLVGGLGKVLTEIILPSLKGLADNIQHFVIPAITSAMGVLQRIGPPIVAGLVTAFNTLKSVLGPIISSALNGVLGLLQQKVFPFLTQLGLWLGRTIPVAAEQMAKAIRDSKPALDAIGATFKNIVDVAMHVVAALVQLTNHLMANGAVYNVIRFAISNLGLALSVLAGLIIFSKMTWITSLAQMGGSIIVFSARAVLEISKVVAAVTIWTLRTAASLAMDALRLTATVGLTLAMGLYGAALTAVQGIMAGYSIAAALGAAATTALDIVVGILDMETLVPIIATITILIIAFFALKAAIDMNVAGVKDAIKNGFSQMAAALDGLKAKVKDFVSDTDAQFNTFTVNAGAAGGNAGNAFGGAWQDADYENRVKLHNDMAAFQAQLDAVQQPAANAGTNVGSSWIESIIGSINRGMPALSEQLNQIVDAMNAVNMNIDDTINAGIYATKFGDDNGTPLNKQQRDLARQAVKFRNGNLKHVALSGMNVGGADTLPTDVADLSGGDPGGGTPPGGNSPYDKNTINPGSSAGGAKTPKSGSTRSPAQEAADVVKAIADGIKAGVEAFKLITSFVTPANLQSKIDEFSKAVTICVMAFQKVSLQFQDKALAHTETFAGTADKVMTSIKNGIDAFANLKNFKKVTAADLQPVIDAIQLSVHLLSAVSKSYNEEGLVNLGNFADAATKSVDLISKASDAFNKLDDFVAPVPDQIQAVVDAAQLVLLKLAPLAKQWAPETLSITGDFADAAGKVVDGLSKALDFFIKLQSMDVTLDGVEAKAAQMVTATYNIAKDFSKLVGSGAFDKEAIDNTGTYADSAGKVVDSLSKAADFINKLNDPKLSFADVSSKVKDIVDQSMSMMSYMRQLVTDLPGKPAWVQKNAADVGAYADNVGKVGDSLTKAADFFNKLSDPRFKLTDVTASVKNIAEQSMKMMDFMSDLWSKEPKWNVDNATKVADYADSAGKVTDSLTKAVDLLDKLRFDTTDFNGLTSRVQALVTFSINLMRSVVPVTSSFNDFADTQAGSFADAAGKVVDGLSKALDFLDKIRTSHFDAPAAATKIQELISFCVSLMQSMSPMASSWETFALEQTGTFADASGKVVDNLGKALDLLEKLRTSRFDAASAATKLTDIENFVSMAMTQFGPLAASWEQFAIEKAGNFADTTGKVVDMLDKSFDLIGKLGTGIKPKNDPKAVFAQLLDYITDFSIQFRNVQGLLNALVDDQSSQVATTVGNVLNGLANSFNFFDKLNTFTGVSQSKVDSFLSGVRFTISRLKDGLLNDVAPDLLDLAKDFGDKMGSTWDMMAKALDFFIKLMGDTSTTDGKTTVSGGLPALDPSRVGMFTAGLKLVIDKLKEGLLNDIAPELLDTMNEFGTKVGPAIDVLDKTLGIFMTMQGDGEKGGLKAIDPDAIGALVGSLYILLHHWKNIVIGGEFQSDFAERSQAFAMIVGTVLDNISKVVDLANKLTQSEKDSGAITALPSLLEKIGVSLRQVMNVEMPQTAQSNEQLVTGVSSATKQNLGETLASWTGTFQSVKEMLEQESKFKEKGTLTWWWVAQVLGVMIDRLEGKNGAHVQIRVGIRNMLNDVSSLLMEATGDVQPWIDAMQAMVAATVAAVNEVKNQIASLAGASATFTTTVTTGNPTVPGLATGGIALKPTLAVIGDGDEPEAVLPLSRLRDFVGNGGGNNQSNATSTTTNNNFNIRHMTVKQVTDAKEQNKRKRIVEDPFS